MDNQPQETTPPADPVSVAEEPKTPEAEPVTENDNSDTSAGKDVTESPESDIPQSPEQKFLRGYDSLVKETGMTFAYKIVLAKNDDGSFNPQEFIVDVSVSPK